MPKIKRPNRGSKGYWPRKRARRILKDLQLLANTGNRYEYQYETEEVEKIFQAIEEQLKETKTHFSVKTKNPKEFSL